MEQFSWPEPQRFSAFPIAKPGYGFIGAAAFTTVILAWIGFSGLAFLSLSALLFICWFFRDPDRVTPTRKGAVVSPADGKVIVHEVVNDNSFIKGPCLKISIFMSVFNVHVNRIPHEGKITRIVYNPGKFVSANLDKASLDNEQNAVVLETSDGKEICFIQIAGLVARRIICGIQEGDELERGCRFGMICFGSRLDVFLPPDTRSAIAVGDKVQAGTSILGYLP